MSGPGSKSKPRELRQRRRRQPAIERTIVLLGHEHPGVPDEVWDLIDEVIEIPMIGQGASLNVSVAGSLVLYRLAGLA